MLVGRERQCWFWLGPFSAERIWEGVGIRLLLLAPLISLSFYIYHLLPQNLAMNFFFRIRQTVLFAFALFYADALLPSSISQSRYRSVLRLQISLPDFLSTPKSQGSGTIETNYKSALLELLKEVPPNDATPKQLTSDILGAVKALETKCETPESDVIPQLAGNWELIWTAQDASTKSRNIFSTWIK